MQKIVAFIQAKALSDVSMVSALDLLKSNPGKTEEVLLMLFQSLYESNLKLMQLSIDTAAKSIEKSTVLTDV